MLCRLNGRLVRRRGYGLGVGVGMGGFLGVLIVLIWGIVVRGWLGGVRRCILRRNLGKFSRYYGDMITILLSVYVSIRTNPIYSTY